MTADAVGNAVYRWAFAQIDRETTTFVEGRCVELEPAGLASARQAPI
jgi:hypothetical protein